MMVLLDENVGPRLIRLLRWHEVRHVRDEGWLGKKNGELLGLAEAEQYSALITADKNIPHQQMIRERVIMVLLLDVHPNSSETQAVCVPKILEALTELRPGRFIVIEGPHLGRLR
jgi:predicted nuclease of predicted toxin-antitoxin system